MSKKNILRLVACCLAAFAGVFFHDLSAAAPGDLTGHGVSMLWPLIGVLALLAACAFLLLQERRACREALEKVAQFRKEIILLSSQHASELEEKSRLSELAFELGNAGYWYKDLASGCLIMSDRARKIVGDSPHPYDPYVWTMDEWFAGVQAADPDRAFSAKDRFRALEEGTSSIYSETYPFRRADGSDIWINDQGVAVRNAGTGKIQIQGLVQDISAFKKIETALDEARLKALADGRAKDVFLANMSHELRTPLNGIIGISSLLRGMCTEPAQESYVKAIDASGKLLLNVLNDILDFTSITSGHFELQHNEFHLRHLIRQYVEPLEEKAAAKCITFAYHIDDDVPSHVVGDAGRLGQVLKKLAENAVKFTDFGGITLHVSLNGTTQDGKSDVRFTLKDTGIGMSEEKIAYLFRPFSQADPSLSRKYGGTGLGLAISNRLVSLLGGQLSVESVENVGSAFTFNVVLEESSALLVDEDRDFDLQELKQRLHGAKILLAEDNEINQIVTCDLLSHIGADVRLAANGREAVSLALSEKYDLVLMDIQMPEMDGIEATTVIRESFDDGQLPIIAMTAHALASDREKSLAAGMNDHLTKPVDPLSLYSTVAYWLRSDYMQ